MYTPSGGRLDLTSARISDDELVEGMRRGDESAWQVLLERYSSVIQGAAQSYARTCHSTEAYESVEDAASGLYLCMVERIRESMLTCFRGECRVKTWIYRLIGDRRQVIKALLMQTDRGRGRADTRLPRLIQQRGGLDREIYRRLVWGKEPSWIGWDLGLSELEARERSEDILELLRRHSPRVYRRIMANRQALRPMVSLGRPTPSSGGDALFPEVEDVAPLPDIVAEQRCLGEHLPQVEHLIEQAIAEVPEDDVRLMILVFDHQWSLSEVASRARLVNLSGITARHQVDYRITRSIRVIVDHICENLPCLNRGNGYAGCREDIAASLKELFRERGTAPYLAPGARALVLPHRAA